MRNTIGTRLCCYGQSDFIALINLAFQHYSNSGIMNQAYYNLY